MERCAAEQWSAAFCFSIPALDAQRACLHYPQI